MIQPRRIGPFRRPTRRRWATPGAAARIRSVAARGRAAGASSDDLT